ncbi:hypothetical protein GYB59_19170 [bacterium]|nr:hypothetical protein [bacterium]
MPYVTNTRGIGFNMKNNDSPFFASRPFRVVLISGFFAILLCFACFVLQYHTMRMERHAKRRAQHAAKTIFKEFSLILCSALDGHSQSDQPRPQSFDDLCDILRQRQAEIVKRHRRAFSPEVEGMIQHRRDPWGTNFFVDIHKSDDKDRLYIITLISAGSDRKFIGDFDYGKIDGFGYFVMVGEMGEEDWGMRFPFFTRSKKRMRPVEPALQN